MFAASPGFLPSAGPVSSDALEVLPQDAPDAANPCDAVPPRSKAQAVTSSQEQDLLLWLLELLREEAGPDAVLARLREVPVPGATGDRRTDLRSSRAAGRARWRRGHCIVDGGLEAGADTLTRCTRLASACGEERVPGAAGGRVQKGAGRGRGQAAEFAAGASDASCASIASRRFSRSTWTTRGWYSASSAGS